MTIYKTASEVKNAIDTNNRFHGVVEVDLDDCFDGLESFDDFVTNALIGENYGYLLEDLNFKIVGCDTVRQIILVEVDADATTLLNETDWLSEFEDQD
jgi:hypothetical protein